jgi:uncharacterized protein (DUF302 family)
MKRVIAAMVFVLAGASQAAPGLETVKSSHDVATTAERLAGLVTEAGFRVFARIDHAAGAASADMSLRPTELLIFGNPKGGTLLMQSAQTVGIDLPLKYLVWEDAEGGVHIGWNRPDWLAERHGIGDRGDLLGKMTGALGRFAAGAAAP